MQGVFYINRILLILRLWAHASGCKSYIQFRPYQYAKQQQEEILIILEENLQGASPYNAEEIARSLGNIMGLPPFGMQSGREILQTKNI